MPELRPTRWAKPAKLKYSRGGFLLGVVIGVSFLVLSSPGVWARALPPAPTPQALGWWSREVGVGRGPTVSRGATPLASLAVAAVPGPEHLPQLDDCYDGSRKGENRSEDHEEDLHLFHLLPV